MGKSSKHDDKPKKKKDSKAKKKKDKGKHRKRSKSSRHASADSSDSGSSSGEEAVTLTPKQQLAQEREAVNILRDLLYLHTDLKQDLRQLLWTLDQGKAAHLSGIANEALRTQLSTMLKKLGCAKAGQKDSYMLAPGQAKSLAVLGFVFDEAPRPPAAPLAPPAAKGVKGPSLPPPAQPQPASDHDHNSDSDSPQPAKGPSGPTAPASPPQPAAAAYDSAPDGHSPPAEQPVSKRIGPAMPTAEMLAAAAAAAAGDQDGVVEEVTSEDSGGDLLVGPVPPVLIEEDEAMPEDAREAEVVRIMRLLRETQAASGAVSKGVQGPVLGVTDAYAVLGVTREQPPGDVKKRYMKLSLLIHPDKCKHKDAHEAFQAVAQAAKVLQDSGLRAALDEALDDKELRAMAAMAAAAQERDRAWRVARGEEVAGSGGAGSAPGAGAPLVREAWMTDLPPERSAALGGAMMSQVSQRAFARFGVKPRGDTTGWTDTPQQRTAREREALLQGGPQGPLLIAGAGGSTHRAGPDSAEAKVLDTFNTQSRKKTLLEQHMEQLESNKQAKTSQAAGPSVRRPFDRERDLELKPKALDPTALIKNSANLGQKFTSSGGSRHFL